MFVGTTGGMEVDLVPKAGFELKFIHATVLKGGIINNVYLNYVYTFKYIIKNILTLFLRFS